MVHSRLTHTTVDKWQISGVYIIYFICIIFLYESREATYLKPTWIYFLHLSWNWTCNFQIRVFSHFATEFVKIFVCTYYNNFLEVTDIGTQICHFSSIQRTVCKCKYIFFLFTLLFLNNKPKNKLMTDLILNSHNIIFLNTHRFDKADIPNPTRGESKVPATRQYKYNIFSLLWFIYEYIHILRQLRKLHFNEKTVL